MANAINDNERIHNTLLEQLVVVPGRKRTVKVVKCDVELRDVVRSTGVKVACDVREKKYRKPGYLCNAALFFVSTNTFRSFVVSQALKALVAVL